MIISSKGRRWEIIIITDIVTDTAKGTLEKPIISISTPITSIDRRLVDEYEEKKVIPLRSAQGKVGLFEIERNIGMNRYEIRLSAQVR